MAVMYICDGCGRETLRPHNWFFRVTDDCEIHGCCRDCIDRAVKINEGEEEKND